MAIERIGRGFEFGDKLRQFEHFKRTAPKIIANNTKNWFLEGFRKGGGQTDASKSGWEPRKPNAVRNAGRGILINTGALMRSIQILSANFSNIMVGTQRIKYAERHNEGLKGMPKREYIGDSKELNESNRKLLIGLVNKIFR